MDIKKKPERITEKGFIIDLGLVHSGKAPDCVIIGTYKLGFRFFVGPWYWNLGSQPQHIVQ